MHRYLSIENEDVRLLFEAVRQFLQKRGYQRRDMTWFSYSSQLIRVLNFNPGLTWSKATWIRVRFYVGISLRVLDGVDDRTIWDSIGPFRSRVTHPQIEDCAISARLDHLVQDRDRYERLTNFTDRSRSHAGCVPQIVEVLETCALPFLESFSTLEEVRKFVKSNRASAFTIREAAKTILCR